VIKRSSIARDQLNSRAQVVVVVCNSTFDNEVDDQQRGVRWHERSARVAAVESLFALPTRAADPLSFRRM
jgi:hypothetical protein